MEICPNCKLEISAKNANTHIPFMGIGKLGDGNRICGKCFVTLSKLNNQVAGSLKKHTIEQIIEIFNTQNTKDSEIETQLKAIGIDTKSVFWGRKELKELPSILNQNEKIVALVIGTYNDGTGLLVATNNRLIFIDKGLLYGLKIEDFGLDKITSIQFESGFLLSEIKIMASGNIAKISNVEQGNGKRFSDTVRNLLSQPKPQNVPETKIDFVDQLERLAKLKDNGIITEEEFNQQKEKILNQI